MVVERFRASFLIDILGMLKVEGLNLDSAVFLREAGTVDKNCVLCNLDFRKFFLIKVDILGGSAWHATLFACSV